MGLFDTIKAKLGLGDASNEAQHKADAPPADATRSSAEGPPPPTTRLSRRTRT